MSNQLIEQVLSACFVLQEVREDGTDNHGEMIKLFLKKCGLPEGYPWCAAFVSYAGHFGLWDGETGKSAWKVPITAGCAVLGNYGKTHDLLHKQPVRGDIFLVYFEKLKRFGHTGYILSTYSDGTCLTVEGNTNNDGSRNGWGVFIRRRRFDANRGDRFLRWVDAQG